MFQLKKAKSLFKLQIVVFISMFFFMIVFTNVSFAKDEKVAKNCIYLEFLGNGLMYSLNYDRMLSNSIGFRIGAGFFSTNDRDSDDHLTVATFPATLNYIKGKGKHKFEIGAGVMLLTVSGNIDLFDFEGSGLAGTATFGYRYQPKKGGFVFRIGFTPLFGEFGFLPFGGLSLGYSF
jgi:hypothetical protein